LEDATEDAVMRHVASTKSELSVDVATLYLDDPFETYVAALPSCRPFQTPATATATRRLACATGS
jgi:hypothetical protein